ncbi:hypothetical protein DWX41_15765 [Hungatella hathewayi]|uniref:Uncharacterized protein n=1 Tax=Hungatella hathewayi TaxID=154046 RepID=A0A3E2WPC0_9FIRM|nr:hypothetical protein DWX41_15765 [Hungatella hathewayi]
MRSGWYGCAWGCGKTGVAGNGLWSVSWSRAKWKKNQGNLVFLPFYSTPAYSHKTLPATPIFPQSQAGRIMQVHLDHLDGALMGAGGWELGEKDMLGRGVLFLLLKVKDRWGSHRSFEGSINN